LIPFSSLVQMFVPAFLSHSEYGFSLKPKQNDRSLYKSTVRLLCCKSVWQSGCEVTLLVNL
jgi:hypothetical protein